MRKLFLRFLLIIAIVFISVLLVTPSLMYADGDLPLDYNSKEFQNKVSGYTNEEFITFLYRTLFNREPDVEGYNNWLAKLNSGTSRKKIVENFTKSKEFQNLYNESSIENLKREGDITIVVMGDSLIVKSTWVQIFNKLLKTNYPDINFNVIISAKNGEYSSGGNERFNKTVAIYNPDIIIIAYGTNDAGGNLSLFKSSMDSIVEKAKKLNSKVFINLIGHIVGYGKKNNYPEFNKIIMQIAKRRGAVTIDVLTPLLQNPGEYLTDGMHYSLSGAAVVAEAVFNEVSKYLK
jgi:lysophospholipase L1-like esterase